MTSDWLQADLPCDITSGAATHSAGDSVYLVLWYRKDSGTPIYRCHQAGGSHWGLMERKYTHPLAILPCQRFCRF